MKNKQIDVRCRQTPTVAPLSSFANTNPMAENTGTAPAAAPSAANYRNVARDIMVYSLFKNRAPGTASAKNTRAVQFMAAAVRSDVGTYLSRTTGLTRTGWIYDVDFETARDLYSELEREIGPQPGAGSLLSFAELTKRAKWARHVYALQRLSSGCPPQAPIDSELSAVWAPVIEECGGKDTFGVFEAYIGWKRARHFPFNVDPRCRPSDVGTLATFTAYLEWWTNRPKLPSRPRKGGGARADIVGGAVVAAPAGGGDVAMAIDHDDDVVGGDGALDRPGVEAERRARIAGEMLAAEREARIETQYNWEAAQRDLEAEREGHIQTRKDLEKEIETRHVLVRACVSTQTGLLREREERERVQRRLYERELHIERLEQNSVGRVGKSPTRRTVAARDAQSHPPDVLVGREARTLRSFNGPGKDATARGLDSEVPVPHAPHRGGGGRVQKADSSARRRGRSQGTAGAR
jgi:hypothetical protein